MKQIKLEFERPVEPSELVIANALLTQLMVTVARIGLRVDNPDSSEIIEKENKHGSEENE